MPVPLCNNSSNAYSNLNKPTNNGTADCICAIVWSTLELILATQRHSYSRAQL